ncbi:MAG: methylated-DNA--[protein]-cysteine S-methyltransferase [bacterium]|nr:methylated-DNA--[protein]-cysteine S-methyltransferase [bacterium]
MLQSALVATPLGDVRVVTRDGAVCALAFADAFARPARTLHRRFGDAGGADGAAARAAARRVAAYFAGEPDALAALTLAPGGTPFQQRVWAAVRAIPAGATVTYGELARRAGVPGAVRAVGSANGANPIWLAIPCHRVLGSDGTLTGYGGGLARKRWLLVHEGAYLR